MTTNAIQTCLQSLRWSREYPRLANGLPRHWPSKKVLVRISSDCRCCGEHSSQIGLRKDRYMEGIRKAKFRLSRIGDMQVHVWRAEPFQNLSHVGSAYPQKASQLRPSFELAAREKQLVIAGQPERIAGRSGFFRRSVWDCRQGIPGMEYEDSARSPRKRTEFDESVM